MKIVYLIFIFTAITAFAEAQTCLPQGITFSTQAQIDSFQDDYPNCTQIEGDVMLTGSNITQVNGLSVLTSIGGSLSVYSENLKSLAGLQNLTSISDGLIIQNNDSLISLEGLENLISVGGGIWLRYNHALTRLSGIDNVITFSGALWITDNDSLCNCSVQFICNYLTGSGIPWIENNAAGCNSEAEVEAGCGVGTEDNSTLRNGISLFPNPSTDRITIETSFSTPLNLSILDCFGRVVTHCQAGSSRIRLDIGDLPPGMYLVRLQTGRTVYSEKFSKL